MKMKIHIKRNYKQSLGNRNTIWKELGYETNKDIDEEVNQDFVHLTRKLTGYPRRLSK